MRWQPFAASLLLLTLAGCSGTEPRVALESVYEVEDGDNGTPLIRGARLEGQLGEGPWGSWANVTIAAEPVAGPSMGVPSFLGGGGETIALEWPANVSQTLRVRIPEGDRLQGYEAHYHLIRGERVPADIANRTPEAILPAGEGFETTLLAPGPFLVQVFLHETGSPVVAANFSEPVRGRLSFHWTATGDVQPQQPEGSGDEWPTPRTAMVDIYTIEVEAGVPLSATTEFRGTYAPGMGTDVDLGLYTPGGDGTVCDGSGGGGATLDPAQAQESVASTTDVDGAWSIQVGNIQGCGGQSYQYSNPGPVPYALSVVAG